jgi:hypothetical protein
MMLNQQTCEIVHPEIIDPQGQNSNAFTDPKAIFTPSLRDGFLSLGIPGSTPEAVG